MNRILLFFALWAAGNTASNSQTILQVFINEQQWNGNGTMSIKPTDTIRIKLTGSAGSTYQVQAPKLEIVLRKRPDSKKEVNYRYMVNRSANPQDQVQRLKKGPKKLDLKPYCTDTKFTSFSTSPVLVIPCNKFNQPDWMLSRIIVHLDTIKEKRGTAITIVRTAAMGWDRKFFRDGFSFWRGAGFP